MKRVLLLATTTGYQTRAFGDAAERLGVELVFATDRCNMLEDPWQDEAIPIRFYDEPRSAQAIVDAAGSGFDGILVVGDRPTVVAALVTERLGLAGHSPAAAAIARNKLLTRERLREAGLLVPWFFTMSVNPDMVDDRLETVPYQTEYKAGRNAEISYPCVLKPLALSGSRGVMRVDDRAAFVAAFGRLKALLSAPDIRAERNQAHATVLVEGFIQGREFALEGVLHHGSLHVLALFDKPDPLNGPFFEETVYITPSREEQSVQDAIVDTVRRAAAAIGLRHGPIHAECRVHGSDVFVLEVAARPIGGLCARTLRFEKRGRESLPAAALELRVPQSSSESPENSPGKGDCPLFPLEELLLRHALGESPEKWKRESAASGVMMIPIPRRGIYRRVDGVDAARAISGIDDVRITAKEDQLLIPLPEGASYLGFIFAHGDTPGNVDRILRKAHAHLNFTIDSEVPVLQSRHG